LSERNFVARTIQLTSNNMLTISKVRLG